MSQWTVSTVFLFSFLMHIETGYPLNSYFGNILSSSQRTFWEGVIYRPRLNKLAFHRLVERSVTCKLNCLCQCFLLFVNHLSRDHGRCFVRSCIYVVRLIFQGCLLQEELLKFEFVTPSPVKRKSDVSVKLINRCK